MSIIQVLRAAEVSAIHLHSSLNVGARFFF